MSANFVSQLRARRDAIRLAPEGVAVLRVRVEIPELWETVLVEATANTSVLAVKEAVIRDLKPDTSEHVEDFVAKLRGWEVLDEHQSLGQAGVVDGSTLLVHYRRRRPVR